MKRFIHHEAFVPVILLLVTVFACIPLFSRGFIPTHDGEYNIVRFMEFFRMLGSGVLFPQWAPTINSGYGLPIFIFYYPLPNYFGAFFHVLGWSFVESVKLTMALGYMISVLFCFLWLKRLFGTKSAFIASMVGAFIPYWFVELYVRGTVPEVIAMAFIFISLYAIESQKKIVLMTSIACLILSHNILALIFIPFLFVYSWLRYKRLFYFILFGVGTASYFWIPALFERQYVVGLNTVNFRDHFAQLYELLIPSWGTAFSATGGIGDKISFQIGVIPIIIIFFAVCTFFVRPNNEYKKITLYMFMVFLFSLFLTLPWSKVLWEMIPILQFTQYPWRFLTFLLPTIPFFTAFLWMQMRQKWIVMIIMIASVGVSYPYMRPVIYESRDDLYYTSKKNFMDGTVSMGNSFSTIWTPWKEKRPNEQITVKNGQVTENYFSNSYTQKKFAVISTNESEVTLPITYFPGWVATVDGTNVPIQYEKEGIITFTVPKGRHTVYVRFQNTPIRSVASIVSILSIFGGFLVATGKYHIIRERRIDKTHI